MHPAIYIPVGKTFPHSQNEMTPKFKGLRMGDINTLGHTPRPGAKSAGSTFKRPGEFLKPQKLKPLTSSCKAKQAEKKVGMNAEFIYDCSRF